MSRKQREQREPRYVFVRDPEKTIEGFATYESAKERADSIVATDDVRVRVRFRTRTRLWDVLVKSRREVVDEELLPQQ